MIKAIVYESNAGHTLEYAKILSKKVNVPFYTIKEATKNLQKGDKIAFLGWIFASKIQGMDKVEEIYDVECYGAVGSYPDTKEYIEQLKKSNNLDEKLFYMRGGIEISKVKGIKKMMLKMVAKTFQNDPDPEKQKLAKIFTEGENLVSEENLKGIVEYINKK